MSRVPQSIEELRNPKRKSGFDHVNREAYPGRKKPYVAQGGGAVRTRGGHPAHAWRGTHRATAEEAAQDYIDFVNGRYGATPATPALKVAGHVYDNTQAQRDPEVEAALGVLRDAKAQREGRQGYVYLIIQVDPGGALRYGKIGYSVNPRKRVAELQTGNPSLLRLHAMRPGTLQDEDALHAKYAHLNVLQEWFHLTKELLLEWDVEHIIKKEARAA